MGAHSFLSKLLGELIGCKLIYFNKPLPLFFILPGLFLFFSISFSSSFTYSVGIHIFHVKCCPQSHQLSWKAVFIATSDSKVELGHDPEGWLCFRPVFWDVGPKINILASSKYSKLLYYFHLGRFQFCLLAGCWCLFLPEGRIVSCYP